MEAIKCKNLLLKIKIGALGENRSHATLYLGFIYINLNKSSCASLFLIINLFVHGSKTMDVEGVTNEEHNVVFAPLK